MLRRPGGEPCIGLLWVTKIDEKTIHADCMTCHRDEVVITGWEETVWADGMMEPVETKAASRGLPS